MHVVRIVIIITIPNLPAPSQIPIPTRAETRAARRRRIIAEIAARGIRITTTTHVTQTARIRGRRGVIRDQNPLKRVAKLLIIDRVDDGVKSGVGVAQPGKDLEPIAGYARLAEGRNDVDAKERDPAQEEGAHDDTYGDGGLMVGHVIGGGGGSNVEGGGGAREGGGRGEGTCYGSDGLDVLLSVAVETKVDT